MNRKVTLLVLAQSITTAVFADIIRGRVLDAQTKEGVPFATISCIIALDNQGMMSMQDFLADSLGRFIFHAPGEGRIIAAMVGYRNSDAVSFSAFSESRRDTIDVGDIKLQPTETMMRALEVTARARRFTMSGDTIVFHPEAFHLEEGARLEELIRQLPGVSVNESGLSWNGRPLRVVMNGEELFGGSAIVKQLPAEAVETIKAYNKASEFSERTGKNDGGEDMVLDLKIKPGFLDRFYGDATAKYQTPKQYEGEITVNRLSDTDPLMLYGEANTMNRIASEGLNSWWSGEHSDGYGLGQFGAVGYQHNLGSRQGRYSLHSFYDAMAGISHEDHWGTDYSETLNYFPDTTSNRLSQQNHQHTHQLIPKLHGGARWEIDTLNTVYGDFSVEFGRQRSNGDERIRQYASPGLVETVSTELLTMDGRARSQSLADNVILHIAAGWTHYIKEGSLSIDTEWNMTDEDATGQVLREITYPINADDNFTLMQDSRLGKHLHQGRIKAEAKRWLTSKILLTADYTLGLGRRHDKLDFNTNGQKNPNESYNDLHHSITHTFGLSSTLNLRPFQLTPRLNYILNHEKEDYTRGVLDTLARRNAQRLEPSLNMKWKINAASELNVNYGFAAHEPELMQTLAYRDATNPLYITEGNTELRNIHINYGGLRYQTVIPSQQLQFYVSAGFHHSDRSHEPLLSYDTRRSAYLSRLENVKGHQEFYLKANVDQGFGDFVRLRNAFSFIQGKNYAHLLQTSPNEPLQLNRQLCMTLRDEARLSFDWKWMKMGTFANIGAQHMNNSLVHEQNTTLWNNKLGFDAELHKGRFIVKTELFDRMRRGYKLSGMNTDCLIWNASASWRCLKGKGKLLLEVEDILNHADNFTSNESANQQVMTWSDQMHHYIRLGFTYHLDAKEKK